MRSEKRCRCALAAAVLVVLQTLSCTAEPPAGSAPDVPRGYSATLQLLVDGRQLGFGPFVGYYFRPCNPPDLSRLEFICFNERQFYTTDLPDGTRLFTGEAVLATLAPVDPPPLQPQGRIKPVIGNAIPEEWLATRPDPKEDFIHFHSCYNAVGSVLTGYWMRHIAVAAFTFDMGGRVATGSVLYHRVSPGPDRGFARIVEFDSGPDR